MSCMVWRKLFAPGKLVSLAILLISATAHGQDQSRVPSRDISAGAYARGYISQQTRPYDGPLVGAAITTTGQQGRFGWAGDLFLLHERKGGVGESQSGMHVEGSADLRWFPRNCFFFEGGFSASRNTQYSKTGIGPTLGAGYTDKGWTIDARYFIPDRTANHASEFNVRILRAWKVGRFFLHPRVDIGSLHFKDTFNTRKYTAMLIGGGLGIGKAGS